MSSASANLYFFRLFQPGYGPKIVTCLLSDLDPIAPAENSDLIAQPIYCTGSGAPSSTTLLAGNYSATTPGTGYLVGDTYLDTSANALYACSTAGSNQVGSAGGSAWQKISGSGGNASFVIWNNQAIQSGTMVRVAETGTYGGVTLTPGTYYCAVSAPAGGSGNQIPQYPEPASGTIYFYMIALGPQQISTCGTGGTGDVYVNASAPL